MKARGRSRTPSTRSKWAAARSISTRIRRRRRSAPRPITPPSISSRPCCQGVVALGTARAIGALSPYVAGKTGTTEDSVDGWFIGFTNDVTVAVWVGYDNGDGKRRSLGSNATGARVALPIFKPIIEDIWTEHIAPKVPLNGPSPEAKRFLADIPIDYMTGDRVGG